MGIAGRRYGYGPLLPMCYNDDGMLVSMPVSFWCAWEQLVAVCHALLVAAYSYTSWFSVVCVSSGHTSLLCRNSWTNHEPGFMWAQGTVHQLGSRHSHKEGATFEGGHMLGIPCTMDSSNLAACPHLGQDDLHHVAGACVTQTWCGLLPCYFVRLLPTVNGQSTAVVCVRSCVHFHSFEPPDLWPLFFVYLSVGRDHSSLGIGSQSHWSAVSKDGNLVTLSTIGLSSILDEAKGQFVFK